MAKSWRSRTNEWLSPRGRGHVAALVVVAMAVLGVSGGTLVRSLPGLEPSSVRWTEFAIRLGAAVFLIEYLARFWSIAETDPATGRARWHYALSLLGLADAIAVLPLLGSPPLPEAVATLAGLVAMVKVAHVVPGIALVAAVLRREARSLGSAVAAMGVLLVLVSGVMYLLEREAQPEAFASIPRAMWWGIVTIASVGYGDVTPVTTAGRVFGGMTMLLGIAMFAVPAGILATGFASEIRRRDFMVTWQTVAGVPLFAGLDAARIGEIARLLKPQIVPGNQVLVRRGDPADAMFFVLSGEVEVDVMPHPARLKAGQYFGEIGLLKDVARTATVTSVDECHLLTLGVNDFRRLMAAYPDLKARIEAVAAERSRG